MKIKVTQADIDNGKPEKLCLCPIALAIERALRKHGYDVKMVEVEPSCVDITYIIDGCASWRAFELPLAARNFIKWFDFGCEVEPFEFELQLT